VFGGTPVLDMNDGSIINVAGFSFAGGITFGGSTYTNIFPVIDFIGTVTYLLDTTGGAGSVNLPLAGSLSGQYISFINLGPNIVTFTPQSAEQINSYGNGNPVVLLLSQYDSVRLTPRASTGYYATPGA
jgi:hypothetical protein